MLPERRPLPLHTKIFIGLVVGAIAGFACQLWLGADNSDLKWVVDNVANPVGRIFLNLIFMIVVPLLFSALVLGVAEIGQARSFGRIGLASLGLTVLLSGLAVVIGLVLVNAFKPGEGITPEERTRLERTYGKRAAAEASIEKARSAKGFADSILEVVPDNPLKSAVEALQGGLLPFMFFALIFGLALAAIEPERALPLQNVLDSVYAVSLKVIEFAMKLAPIGVGALVFATSAALGVSAFAALSKYAALVLFALGFHLFVVYSVALWLIAKRNPWQFFGQIRAVMLTAFATASSNATLPTALRVAEEDVGLPRQVSRFVLTVGATANQNGTALFEGITVLFLAQLFGVQLDLAGQLTVMGLAILAGVGTAGVPGGSWPMIAVILLKVGVPPEAIGICLGIDRILDMSRTVLNVTGDVTIAACVSTISGTKASIPSEVAG